MTSVSENTKGLHFETIIQDSRSQTGLEDIGEPPIYNELEFLIDALNREAQLNARGVLSFQHNLTQALVKRQRIHQTFIEHPEIFDEPIAGPIFITGLPRSGTTKMHRMMAMCSEFQKLPLWKILNPLPLGPSTEGGSDPRIAFAHEASRIMREQFPAFYAGHPMNAMDPDEEEWLLDLAMRGYTNNHTAWVPSFETFMDGQDFESWYIFLKKLLQLFQWQDGATGKPWLLKAPSHLRHMKLLFKHFPDAVIVHCHRDPVTTTISLARLMESAHRMYSDFDHPNDIGRFTLNHWSKQMEGYMNTRPELEQDHPFFDVAYREITGNTLATIDSILAKAGFPVSEQSRQAMAGWDKDNPPGKHGKHSYTLDRYDLSPEYIRSRYSAYLDRFGHIT